MTQEEYVLSFTRAQWKIFQDINRFRIIIAGRRFGKTFLAIREMFRAAIKKNKAKVWYVAPTYAMAKQIAWVDLKDTIPEEYIQSKNETELSITLINGSIIALRGADNPDSLRGPGLDFLVLDEVAFMDVKVWKVVRPMVSDIRRNGRVLFISSPDGFNWVYDIFVGAQFKKNWSRYQFTTKEGGNVSDEELENAKADLDIRSYRQEYEASFENMAGRVYYCFDRNKNCVPLSMSSQLPVLVGMDFNVDPMTAVIGQKFGDQLHIFNEIEIPGGDTEMMCQEIVKKYPHKKIIVYPDPTGNKRQTSAPVGKTDFTIIRSYGFILLAPSSPYPVAKKLRTMNAALCNAKEYRRLLINKGSCPKLQKALDGLTFAEGTSLPNKNLGLDHITDAVAYLTLWELPIQGENVRQMEVSFA